jgi:MFS transporter, ACS family, hexuronate transporter
VREEKSPLRWLMILFAFSATLINYLDRQALSVAVPAIRSEFHISNIGYSRILFGFLLAYTVMNGVSGLLVDKLGTRLGYGLCVAWWSISAGLHAFARGPISLFIFRFLLGMGEAGNWPSAVKLVAEWFPSEERAFASGLFNSGSAVGAVIAPPLIAFFLIRFSWQSSFVLVSCLGFIWVSFWLPAYRTPAKTHEMPSRKRSNIPRLLRSRFVWSYAVAKLFLDPSWYFFTFWFPQYLKSSRHFSMEEIGKYAWIPFAVAGFGNIVGGLLARGLTWTCLNENHARKAAAGIAAVTMAATIPAAFVVSAWWSIALISVGMAGYTACLANMLAFPSYVVSPDDVATVFGIAGVGSGFGAMLFILLGGWLIERYSYTPAFFLFGAIPSVCALVIWTWMGPLQLGTEPRSA